MNGKIREGMVILEWNDRRRWGGCLLVIFLVILSLLAASLTLPRNAKGTVVGGYITEDTTWTLAGSPYYVVDTIYIDEGVTLTIEPGVEVLFDKSTSMEVLFGLLLVNGKENGWVTFGPNTTAPYDGYWGGIRTLGTGRLSMYYINISYAFQLRVQSSYNEIHHCRLSHFLYYALAIAPYASIPFYQADYNNISHCEITNNLYYGDTGEAVIFSNSHNNTFVSNVVAENTGTPRGRLGLRLLFADDNTITNNVFVNNTFSNVWVYAESYRNLIDHNYMSGGLHGVQVVGEAEFNIISNNTIADNEYGGVTLYAARGNTYNMVENNHISGSRYGVWYSMPGGNIAAVGNNTIRNNTIVNNEYGFNISATAWNTSIYGNEIAGNEYGIFISSPHRNMIWSNDILGNSICGLCLEGAREISMRGNKVSGNGVGFSLNDSWWNEISDNGIENSTILGLRLHTSILNRIYHNDIINNAQQAYDDSIQSNEWDDGYPSGGNYWSDYTGLDLYSGPNQDIPGSDGIGDLPYVIDADSQDNYPLTEPTILPPPSPPTNISAVLIGSNHRDVMISWNLSRDDKGGPNVVRYDIYRSATYDWRKGYPLYDSVPNGTSSYVDSGAGEGNPSSYFYYVCAVNVANNSSCSSNQAGKFTRPLSVGPNLVSTPLIQSNVSIEYVLQTIRYDKAWYYDSLSHEWKWFMKYKNYRRDLWNINHTMGIWVNVTRESNLTAAGMVPASTSIHLAAGWNLVSFPSLEDNYTVADLKLGVSATRVEGFGSSSSFPYYLRVVQDTEKLRAGFGYWIKVSEDTLWVISN